MDAVIRDFRLAVRALARVPAFTAVAVLTLGIGIGTTALMFTTVDAAFLQPLPFADSNRLARIWQVSPRSDRVAVALLTVRDLQRELKSFSSIAATLGAGSVNVSNGADAERAVAALVSRNFFAAMGTPPALGRSFSAEEAAINGPVAVVISDGLWERFFARSPDVLSRTLSIEGVPYPIVGVMPPNAGYPQGSDLWATFERNGDYGGRTAHNFEVIGRLAPGVTLAQAQAEVDAVTRALHAAHADMGKEGYAIRVVDLRTDLLGTSATAVTMLFAAVGLVLLIACANVVNLLLARSVSRESQTTLRIALGASRADVTRLFVMESLTLAVAGGTVGAALMFWTGDIAAGLIPATLLPSGALQPDARAFAVVALLMAGVGILCGLAASRHTSRLHVRTTLAAGAPSISGEPRAMGLLVAAEVALAVMLLAGAGLLVRSLMKLEAVDPGFRRDGAVVAAFSLGAAPGSPYADRVARAQFFDRLLERARAVPGVGAAGVTSSFPFTFCPNALLQEEGVPLGEWGRAPSTDYRVIGGEYFQALGVPLRAGRYFTDADRAGAPHVAIVNETAVRVLWNGTGAVGRRVRMLNIDGIETFATVVGVIGDVRHRGIVRPPTPEVFFPYAQRPTRTFGMTLVARTDLPTAALAAPLREAVRQIDAGVPVRVDRLEDRLATQLAGPRFRTGLLSGFAGVAAALAAFGIFGVVSYSVARRTREMGIRVALGARASDVRRLVLRRALTPVAAGVFVGGTAALLASRLVSSLTFEVRNTDPVSFAAAIGLLLAVALVGAWLPARRATRVSPLEALRSE